VVRVVAPLHRATGHLDALAVEGTPHLARPIHPVVVLMDPLDQTQQLGVANRPATRWSTLGGVVGLRDDLATMLAQHAADRLDPEDQPTGTRRPVGLVLIDEPHERGDGRSSSAAKKADAVFKIAFARRNSRFSRSSSTSRRRSSLDRPGLAPESI
jgi:hypothetical protein